MILDANKIDDRIYHRRRAVLGGLGALMMVFLLADRLADNGLALDFKGWLLSGAQLGMLVFFARLLIKEIIEMRRHG